MVNIFKSLAQIDRRVFHLLNFLIVSLLLIYPIGLPLLIDPSTQATYNVVKSLKPGNIVLINYGIGAAGWDELKGQCESVDPHVFEQPGVKIIYMTNDPQGVPLIEKTLSDMGKLMAGKTSAPWYELNGKQYLVDWVNLGYLPGGESMFASLGGDFRGTIKDVDWYGNKIGTWLDQIGLKSAADISLAISYDLGDGYTYLMRHFYLAYKTPIICGAGGVIVPRAITYFDTGQLVGFLKSTRGGAEYQFLSGYKGAALVSMDAYSAMHIFLVVIVVLGNIGYFGWERKARREK